ncbi:MAG: hypothetical protein E5V57_05570 [Mesorhizobium sp.]|nr:MAG: hypothetical protein E5V57_05570 [Mesorhizobium sp.]
MTPKIGVDFRKRSCAKSKCYSVLCASPDARRCRQAQKTAPSVRRSRTIKQPVSRGQKLCSAA